MLWRSVITKVLLPLFLPRAIDWCRDVAQRVAQEGLPLTETALEDARAVGVIEPRHIRVLVLNAIPTPKDPMLAIAGRALGLVSETTAGLALGYSILVRRGRLSRRLLSHECRHVAQFEMARSLDAFLTAYLNALVAVGYEECQFEVDARSHELPNATLLWRPF